MSRYAIYKTLLTGQFTKRATSPSAVARLEAPLHHISIMDQHSRCKPAFTFRTASAFLWRPRKSTPEPMAANALMQKPARIPGRARMVGKSDAMLRDCGP